MLADTVAMQQEDPHTSQLIAIQQQTQQLQNFCDEFCEEIRAQRYNLWKGLCHSKQVLLNHEDKMKHLSAYLSSFDHPQHHGYHDIPVSPQWNAGNIAIHVDYQVSSEEQVSEKFTTTPFLQNTPACLDQHHRQKIVDISMDDRHDGLARQGKHWDLASATWSQNMSSGRAADIDELESSSSLSGNTVSSHICPLGRSQGINLTQGYGFHNPPKTMPSKTDLHKASGTEGHTKGFQMEKFWTRQPHILLVEEHHTCMRIGRRFLRSLQCCPHIALNGSEAVEKLRASRYDLVLMSIIKPDTDAILALNNIRQFDRTPVIAMTSTISQDGVDMYLQHGMNDVLPRPFSRTTLLGKLERFLGHLRDCHQQ